VKRITGATTLGRRSDISDHGRSAGVSRLGVCRSDSAGLAQVVAIFEYVQVRAKRGSGGGGSGRDWNHQTFAAVKISKSNAQGK
jgi:hypothetical protein